MNWFFRTKGSQFLWFNFPIGLGVYLKETQPLLLSSLGPETPSEMNEGLLRPKMEEGVVFTRRSWEQRSKGPGHEHIPVADEHTSHPFKELSMIQAHCGQKEKQHHLNTLLVAESGDNSVFTEGATIEMIGTTTLKEPWERGASQMIWGRRAHERTVHKHVHDILTPGGIWGLREK